ncbi:hypothetical protein [Frankia sp. EAN1pec]|uniref:hypothetical protein n=1 Tax=Parafrankia sp. (strain EAN1pec) TaxID=298653 RepID=UPI0002DDD032
MVRFGIDLDSAARGQLVTAVAERLAAGVEPGALAEQLGGGVPAGADPLKVLLDCVRQTRSPRAVEGCSAYEGQASAGPSYAQSAYEQRVTSGSDGPGVGLVQALIDAVHEVTGQTIDRELASKGVAMVLRTKDGTPRAVSDPVAYLRTAVEAAPTRFLPVLVPPRLDGRRESKAARRARGFEELRAWASEATDSGQRLDNTGVTVVDQDGQTAEPAPAEPPNDPWAVGTTPSGWMASPTRQRDPEPHVCRYGCRPGQHTYEDPETGVPTRCPIHHEHARHREAA